MKGSARLLTMAGLGLILAGFLFGLAFSFAVDHQPRLVAYDDYQSVFEMVSTRGASADWEALQQRINAASVAHRRATDVHAHSVNMGLLLILVGLLAPLLSRLEKPRRRALLLLVGASCLYPLALLMQFFGLITVGEYGAALGAALVIVALALFYLGVSRAIDLLPRS